MTLMRKAMYVLVSSILLFVITVPNVMAQTTSITDLESPTRALTGKDVTAKVAVNYNRGYNGHWFFVSIFEPDTNTFATGTAISSQATCWENTGRYANAAICGYTPTSTSGSDVVTFDLKFYTAKTYTLYAFVGIEDYSYTVITDSMSQKTFTILVTDKVSFTVRAPSGVIVTVDGAQQNAGNVFANVNPGTHIISVPDLVNVDNGTRLRFDRWADGFSLPTRTVYLQDDATFEVTYVTQHSLTLESPQGSPTGAGWYDEGSSAQFSANATQAMSGVLGSLGGKWAFQGWYEGQSLVNKSSSASITMGRAHSLTARWAADYTIPLVIIGVVAGAVLVGITVIFLRRRRPTLTPQPVQVEPTPVQPQVYRTALSDKQFCLNCGAELPLNSKFCNKCGSAQT
jgi:ribosomal protein L40E